jgi:hypothetical protein
MYLDLEPSQYAKPGPKNSKPHSTGGFELIKTFRMTRRQVHACRNPDMSPGIGLKNRCTPHNPVKDGHGFGWVIHRMTLAGDRPD